MSKSYSPATFSFYESTIHSEIPLDAIQISDELHQQLLEGLSGGDIIVVDNGLPTLAPQPAPTLEAASIAARGQRDALLSKTDFRVTRAVETGGLINSDWVEYRQALRDVPTQKGFPYKIKWPVSPSN